MVGTLQKGSRGELEVVWLNSETLNTVKVVPLPQFASRCRWAPDGKHLVVHDYPANTYRVVDALLGSKKRDLLSVASPQSLQWSGNGKHLAGVENDSVISVWDVDRAQKLFVVWAGPGEELLVLSPEGHYRGGPDSENELVYVVQTDQGQETFTPAEFSKHFNWKNDPDKVLVKP